MLSPAAMFLDNGARLPFGSDGEWTNFECQPFQHLGFVCGGNNGLFMYWGAKALEMQKVAMWAQQGILFSP
jgi:hypothetical protein